MGHRDGCGSDGTIDRAIFRATKAIRSMMLVTIPTRSSTAFTDGADMPTSMRRSIYVEARCIEAVVWDEAL